MHKILQQDYNQMLKRPDVDQMFVMVHKKKLTKAKCHAKNVLKQVISNNYTFIENL